VTRVRAVWLLPLAACATVDPCVTSKLSPMLGCYRATETPAWPDSGPGTLLLVDEHEILIYVSERNWARYRLEWSPPSAKDVLNGTQPDGQAAELKRDGAGTNLSQAGQLLARGVKLEGGDARTAADKLHALPSWTQVVERAKRCFADYAALMPDLPTFANVKPETWQTTSSAVALMGIAQFNLAGACKPLPQSCDVPQPNPKADDDVAARRAKCAAPAPAER
jgi:hypothetical protein